MRDLSLGLAGRGWRVSVAAPPGGVGIGELAEAGVEVVPFTVPRGPSRRDPAALRRLTDFARSAGVDLAHFHSSKAGAVGALLARRLGLRSVYTPHAWSFGMRLPWPARLALAGLEAGLARVGGAQVLAIADSEAREARRWRIAPPGRISVVHTGIPALGGEEPPAAARGALDLPGDRAVVAWIGRTGAQKRPEALVPVARALSGVAVVAALGHGLHGDRRLADDLAAAGVRILPEDTPPARLLAASDLLLLTSAWESFPLVVLEAMRAGRAVVAPRLGGIAEQVEHGRTGYLTPPDDAALIERVTELVGDPGLAQRFGHAGRTRFQDRFELGRMLDGIEGVYRSVLRRDA